ncbi:MAG TPA: hypothetical protein VFT50_12595 [Baekduia sp.]|nr:hypothetical protein [Baekduia sp.]
MVARIVLLAGAAALIALGVARTDAHRSCASSQRAAFAVGAGQQPRASAAAVGRRLVDRCRDVQRLVDGASAFLRAGAVGPAGELARAAVRREPERRDAWIALWHARQAAGDDAGAQRALGRARQLDPLSFRR